MSALINQGGFGCVYHPAISCDGSSEKDKKNVSKLQKITFNSKNELLISKIIMKIDGYQLYFIPIESDCKIDLRDISDKKMLDECDVIRSEKEKYTIMKLTYVKSTAFYKSLISDSHGKLGRKKTILSIVESFSYLLFSIEKLLEKDIIHFDLKGENIIYNHNTGYPLIIDFGISIPLKKLNDANMKEYFYGFIPEYYIWCIDIHIINFLLYETKDPLTESNIKLIASLYSESNKGLDPFSNDFRKQYEDLCVTQMRQFVGQPREVVIQEMISRHKTWDLYSIGIAYLKLFKYMFPKKFHKNSIIIMFSQILLFNIHPDPQKRLSAEETRTEFENIFYTISNIEEYSGLISSMDYDENLETRKINEDIMHLQKLFTSSIKNKSARSKVPA